MIYYTREEQCVFQCVCKSSLPLVASLFILLLKSVCTFGINEVRKY